MMARFEFCDTFDIVIRAQPPQFLGRTELTAYSWQAPTARYIIQSSIEHT